MAHPKRKTSKTRRDKRRTHYKAEMPQISVCTKTGESHLYHRAYWHVANSGYNVAKYLPFGPIHEVMPYLMRRLDENSSISSQTNRELQLIKKELKRRKN